jgi:hypothetical protein
MHEMDDFRHEMDDFRPETNRFPARNEQISAVKPHQNRLREQPRVSAGLHLLIFRLRQRLQYRFRTQNYPHIGNSFLTAHHRPSSRRYPEQTNGFHPAGAKRSGTCASDTKTGLSGIPLVSVAPALFTASVAFAL